MAERISSAEHEIMEVLWRESPLTAVEVAERVPPAREWSIRTVKTLLSRLLAKGVLRHEAEGRRYLYRPAVERGDYVAQESRRLLDRLFGGSVTPLVAHLAEHDSLTPRDIAEIEAERAPSDPKVYTRIHVHFVVTGKGLDPAKVQHAIELSATRYCSASIMLGKTAAITHDFEISEAA